MITRKLQTLGKPITPTVAIHLAFRAWERDLNRDQSHPPTSADARMAEGHGTIVLLDANRKVVAEYTYDNAVMDRGLGYFR